MEKKIIQKELAMTLHGNFISRVSRFISYEKTQDGVMVRAGLTNKFNRSEVGSLQDLFDGYAGGKGTLEDSSQFVIRYSFISPEILRVTTNLTDKFEENRYESEYFKLPGHKTMPVFSENDDYIQLKSSVLNLRIYKKTKDQSLGRDPQNILSFELFDKKGNSILKEEIDEKSIYYGYFAPPLGREKGANGDEWTVQSFQRGYDEDFYGFGEQFTDFNKRGMIIDTWNSDSGNCSASLSYKNIPFFISTKGYGFLLGSDCHSIFDMGSKTQAAWSVKTHGKMLDYFIIIGKKPSEILEKYYTLTGKPGFVPKWSYGLWMSSIYSSAQQVIDVVKKFRAMKFPADVIHIDPPWMGLGSLLCNFQWGDKFGDHKKMIEVMKENNFKLCLYQTPYIPIDKPIFDEGVKDGYLVKDKDGKILTNAGLMNFWSPEFAYIDFTNPQACKWIQDKVEKLLKEGCSVVKLDLGELYPEEALYYNGMDGWEGHNFVIERYAHANYEVTQKVQGNEACVWRRAGGIGAARYPIHWAGDVKSSYDEMAGQLRAILGAGLSGFIFFSHDIGGFQGNSDEKLYIRWFQFGMFTSHSRAHGGTPHEPWNKGKLALKICKKFVDIRYSLLPHIYSAGIECCNRGVPMLKPLYLVYPDDLNVRNISDEYIFADEFLVAPVMTPENNRKVYLPEGTWIDYWNKKNFQGLRWLDYDCPLDKMPVFIRKGSIIVRTPVLDSVPEDYWKELIIDIYPDKKGEKVFYTSPDKKIKIKYNSIKGKLKVTAKGLQCKYKINIIK